MLQLEKEPKTYCEAIEKMVAENDIGNFLNWDVIKYAMFCPSPPTALEYLESLPDWDTKWKSAIVEVPTGNPPFYTFSPFKRYPRSSGNLIHHVNHIARFLQKTKCKLEDLSMIYEFGAGYGCMCRLIHKLGFTGKYVIMDFPIMLKVQRYYLEKTVNRNIGFVSDENKFTEQIAGDNNLFIATWSISEVPFSLRESILSVVCDNVDYILLAIGGGFDFDNDKFFAEFVERSTMYRWDKVYIPYLSKLKCYYLFGERK